QSRMSFANKVFQGEVFWGADRHIRRGGSGVEWGGDACVALAGGKGVHRNGTRATQASPPTSSTTPAPTGTKSLPKRHDKKPPPESPTPAPTGDRAMRQVEGNRTRGVSDTDRKKYHDERT